VLCVNENSLGFEVYILLGGLCLTVAVLCFAAYSKLQVKLSAAEILSTLLAAGDALTDIAFTIQRLGIMHTTADHIVAALLLLFVLLPTAASASQVALVLRSPHLDAERMKELSAFYAFVLLVALTKMELMRLLPWRKAPTMYDGLPDKRLMLRIWVLVMCLEDVPQLAIQATVVAIADKGGVLAPLSIAFSLSAIVWRGLRKMIYLIPPNARIAMSEITGSGRIITSETTPQPPAKAPSATAALSVASDTLPPAYDHNGGLELEQVVVTEKKSPDQQNGGSEAKQVEVTEEEAAAVAAAEAAAAAATAAAAEEEDYLPPAYDRNGGLEIEQVDVSSNREHGAPNPNPLTENMDGAVSKG